MRKIIYMIIIILLISIMLISSIRLYRIFKEDKKEESIFRELTEIVNENNNKEKEESILQEKTVNMKELYRINNDIIGWLKIENTNIDYPVMQTKQTPNYYLKRNFYKQYSSLGTPYMAESCDIETSDNLIIYAHNIKGKKMFGELVNYKSKEYYNNHKIIKFYSLIRSMEYEIIAVFKTVAYTGFQYYEFYNAQDKEEFDAFINKCKELSFYDTNKNAEYGDKLITLSTCEYSQENSRMVIVAKKIV